MRSESMAATPHSLYAYSWKQPAAHHLRAVLTSDRADGAHRDAEARAAEHPALSWKAYLASKDFQNLASELADTIFSPSRAAPPRDTSRPPSLLSGVSCAQGLGKPLAGLLVPALQESSDAEPAELPLDLEPLDLAIAA
jgi:hypothetical protein